MSQSTTFFAMSKASSNIQPSSLNELDLCVYSISILSFANTNSFDGYIENCKYWMTKKRLTNLFQELDERYGYSKFRYYYHEILNNTVCFEVYEYIFLELDDFASESVSSEEDYIAFKCAIFGSDSNRFCSKLCDIHLSVVEPSQIQPSLNMLSDDNFRLRYGRDKEFIDFSNFYKKAYEENLSIFSVFV